MWTLNVCEGVCGLGHGHVFVWNSYLCVCVCVQFCVKDWVEVRCLCGTSIVCSSACGGFCCGLMLM